MPGQDDQWYTNKDLHEQIMELANDLADLSTELKLTREVVRKYNGLRQDLLELTQRINSMEKRSEGRASAGQAIRDWGGWIVAMITFLLAISGVMK
jgi:hypothetical protein